MKKHNDNNNYFTEDDVTGVMNRDATGCLFYAIAILLAIVAAITRG